MRSNLFRGRRDRRGSPGDGSPPASRYSATEVLRRPSVRWVLACVFVATGVFLPQGWYDTLPRPSHMPPETIKGVTLLRLSFVFEGLAFAWLALSRWRFTRLREAERLAPAAEKAETFGLPAAYWALAAITAVATILRFLRINADLWNDEIYSLKYYAKLPLWQVAATNLDAPNHLLNTVLVNISMALFGQQEWAIRLPAVIFGIATVVVTYWVGRFVLSRQGALGAALLLSVSYHHIWFSQNARGYSPYLFFSLLASGLFVKGLQEDRRSIWALYVMAMLFNFASLFSAGYVLGAHVMVGALALLLLRRRGRPSVNLLKRLALVFGVLGLLVFQLYAAMLPQIRFLMRVYSAPAMGYAPFSSAMLGELARSLSAAFGPAVLGALIPLVAVGLIGFVAMFRRQWTMTLALSLPEVLTVALAGVQGQVVPPRLLLLALPAAILATVSGIFRLSELATRALKVRIAASQVATALVIVLSLGSLASLLSYYAVPKQPFRATIQYVQERRKTGGIILVMWLAGLGFEYYGPRYGLVEGRDYFIVQTSGDVDTILSSHPGAASFFVTTLPRLMHIAAPDLEARVTRSWTRVRRFRGTLGGGDITIWEQP